MGGEFEKQLAVRAVAVQKQEEQVTSSCAGCSGGKGCCVRAETEVSEAAKSKVAALALLNRKLTEKAPETVGDLLKPTATHITVRDPQGNHLSTTVMTSPASALFGPRGLDPVQSASALMERAFSQEPTIKAALVAQGKQPELHAQENQFTKNTPQMFGTSAQSATSDVIAAIGRVGTDRGATIETFTNRSDNFTPPRTTERLQRDITQNPTSAGEYKAKIGPPPERHTLQTINYSNSSNIHTQNTVHIAANKPSRERQPVVSQSSERIGIRAEGVPVSHIARPTAQRPAGILSESATSRRAPPTVIPSKAKSSTVGSSNVLDSDVTRAVRSYEHVIRNLSQLEKVVQQNRPAASVQRAMESLARTVRATSSVLPSMAVTARQITMIARAFSPLLPDSTLSVRIVQANLPSIKETIIRSNPQLNLALKSGIRERPQTVPSSNGGREITQRVTTSRPFVKGEFTKIALRSGALNVSAEHRSIRAIRGGTVTATTQRVELRGQRNSSVGDRETTPHARTSSSRLAATRGQLTRAYTHTERLKLRQSGAGMVDNKTTAKDQFIKISHKIEKGTPRNLSDKRSLAEAKGVVKLSRSGARRFELLRKLHESRKTVVATRKTPGARGVEVAQQQELAKLTQRVLKKLSLFGEEELLGQLSQTERFLFRDMLKKLDGTTTSSDLKRLLSSTRKRKNAHSSPLTTTDTSTTGATSNVEATADTNVMGTEPHQNAVNGSQPSKSLDLVTGKVDDGGNRNSYEPARTQLQQ